MSALDRVRWLGWTVMLAGVWGVTVALDVAARVVGRGRGVVGRDGRYPWEREE